MDLIDKIADFSSLQTSTVPKDILLDEDTTSLLKEKSTTTKTDSSYKPSLIMPIPIISKNNNFPELVQEKIISVSSNSMIPVFSFITSTIPLESSPAVVLSSLSQINSLVTSIKSYMVPIESPKLGYIGKSESMPLQTEEDPLKFNNDDDIHTNIQLLPVMQSKDLIHLMKVDDIAVNLFYAINKLMPTTCNNDTIMMSPTENVLTMSLESDQVENISVMKHANENEVDLSDTMYNVNDNETFHLFDTTNYTKGK